MMLRSFVVVCAIAAVALGCSPSPESPPSVPDTTAADSIAAGAPGTDIYLAPLTRRDDGTLRLGAPTNVTDRPGYDNQPSFTQDGGALLFSSLRDGQTDVYRYDLAGDSAARLTSTPESEYSPTSRPNGMMTVVRVETDGRQRLWEYTPEGAPEALVLPGLDAVGYHAWVDDEHVALFVLGEPPTLQYATVDAGTRDTMASRIGRSLQALPDARAVSFVQVAADSTTTLHTLYADTRSVRRLAMTPGRGRGVDHAWTPGGTVLMADSTRLFARGPDARRWRAIADLSPLEPSRLAVSPDGSTLALVAADRP